LTLSSSKIKEPKLLKSQFLLKFTIVVLEIRLEKDKGNCKNSSPINIIFFSNPIDYSVRELGIALFYYCLLCYIF